MILSMTGYGKAICELPQKKISIELKSLNSKQLDINTRLPNLYREKDIEIRNTIGSRLFRGKVDLSFYIEAAVQDKITSVNQPVIEAYYEQLKPLADKLQLGPGTDYLKVIMSLPDTVKVEQPELDESEWEKISQTLNQALDDIITFRKQEGKSLEQDISQRIERIAELLTQVSPYEEVRVEKIKNRLKEGLKDLADKNKVDENRFEQELILYLEKLDITEEKVRLKNHLEYFIQTMNTNEPVGKKLGFIAQEIGREINTLGSKASDANIQRLVIQMKDELEKIKEQILNTL